MRIWDIPIEQLCNKHLVAEHHECHCIFNIITQGKKGFANHPEVKRWRGKLLALYIRHELQVIEAKKQGLPMGAKHESPIDLKLVSGRMSQDEQWQSTKKQIELLRARCEKCEA